MGNNVCFLGNYYIQDIYSNFRMSAYAKPNWNAILNTFNPANFPNAPKTASATSAVKAQQILLKYKKK
jgi:hypothetical protein